MSILLGIYASLIAAVLPTICYVLLFYWADRYEREPGWLAAVAFLWGAIPAVIASLIGEFVLGVPLIDAEPSIRLELVESAIFAPVVEEIAKGLALLGIFLWLRHEFDGVLDGLLYGALIGFGFAMTENLLYFIGAFSEGGFGGLTLIFLLRVVLFGLNHSFYTALTGIGFGLTRESKSRWRWLWPVVGLSLAILTHALHNFGASMASVNTAAVAISLLVAVGGGVTLLLTLLLAWQQERGYLRATLAEEVGILLSPEEFRLLTGRWRNPLRKRPAERAQVRRLQQLVELALRKQRLVQLGSGREPTLAGEVEALRAQLAQGYQDL
jgi:protease PrsW